LRSSLLPRLALGFLLTYMVLIGATFNGILTAPTRFQAVLVLGISIVVWLLLHWRKSGSHWHRTALDAAILLWVLAFVVSLVANLDSWRRIVMGLWYMGAYIGMWYALHDALANRLITRVMLVDVLLFAGLMIIVFGYLQVQTWMRDTLPLITAGDEPLILPRPVSTLGNPNTLAAALVMLLPLSVGRALTAKQRFWRWVMLFYSLAAVILLLLTYSRGGWLASVVALALLLLWLLAENHRLSPAYWRAWWKAQRRSLRLGLLAAAGVVLVALVVGAILFVETFTIGGRTLDLRTFLYDTALAMFAEKPLTGHGLFTFGAGLARLNSVPPTQPHSHAHDLPLQVAAELGILGVAALLLTLWLAFRAVRANLRAFSPVGNTHREDRLTVILAATAFVAFCAHHLPDLAAMNPAIMVLALVALVAAAAPAEPQPLSRPAGRVVTGLAVGGFTLLLASGLWGSLVYWQYTDAVSYGINSGDYLEAAARLEPVIASDPEMAVYHQQRGFLLGLAAAEGSTSVLPDAIAEFERYTTIAPYYSIGWANLGALYAQAGDYERAVEAMGHAVERAPAAASLPERLIEYQAALTAGHLEEQTIRLPISLDRDDEYLPDINHIQWLRLSILRQFLPQVRYGE
jgi:O-antigen ligase